MRLVTVCGDDLAAAMLRSTDTIQLAMQQMNATGRTFVLVSDDDSRLKGVAADGDLRRFLARGGSVDDALAGAINPSPITKPHDMSAADIRAFMTRRGLEYLPLLEGNQAVSLCILERVSRPSEMTAVIIAGGLGSRLAPLTDDCPKPLLPLGGRPILSRIVEQLRDQSVTRFTLAVNYLSSMIVDYYDDGADLDCTIEYVHETKQLGTGGALSLIDPESLSDPFLCLNGDAVTDLDVEALRDTHLSNKWDATMVVRDHHYTVPYGVVDADDDGTYRAALEKPVQSFLINAGMYMLSKSALTVVPHDQPYDLPTLFDDLSASGMRGGTHVHSGRWLDIGTMSEYRRAQTIFEGRTT